MKSFTYSLLSLLLFVSFTLSSQNLDQFWSPKAFLSESPETEFIEAKPKDLDIDLQEHSIHTPELSKQIAQYKAFKAEQQPRIELRQSANTTIWIPVQFHIAQQTGTYGNQAISNFTIYYYFNQLNTIFKDADIQFYQCGPINYIVDNSIYTLSYGNRSLLDPHDIPGVMNMYFVNQLSNYCGTGDYPSVGEKVIYATNCFGFEPVTVLTHLIGQFLSLYPTHGTSSTAPELVNDPNCAVTGDEICDTPADPNLFASGYDRNTCSYTGNAVDANNQLYQPDATNYMSYALGGCRDHFTTQQLARLYNGASVDRASLTGCNITATCANPINQFPYQEGFENGWNGWEQMEIDYYDFTLQTGGTPTVGTGPSAAAEGNYYIYSEATNNLLGTAIMSPCFDLTNIGQPNLSFQYHMFGPHINFLAVQVSLDGGFWWFGTGSQIYLAK